VAQIYPRALGSLSVASYDSQGYGGGMLSRPHTRNMTKQMVGILFIFLEIKTFLSEVRDTQK
jgi:hypothetical protein